MAIGPTPTLRFDRPATDYLIGDNTASAGPATIHVDNAIGGDFVISLVELRPDATRHDFTLFENGIEPGRTADWFVGSGRELPVLLCRSGGPDHRRRPRGW